MPVSPDALPKINREPSIWTRGEKIRRILWQSIGQRLLRLSFHNWYGYRRFLLRRFGASVAGGAMIRPTVTIEIPWHLRLAEDCVVGDHAILYSLGTIEIGARATVSQYAHLCAGTHDESRIGFPLVKAAITVENDAWIAADAFVGPGVTIGHHTVVGARSAVFRDLPAGKVCVGTPARPIKDRVLHP